MPNLMPRPRIGLTLDSGENPSKYALHSDYAASIEMAGGLPIPIPFRSDYALIPEYLDLLDGILFTGGDDLDPALYSDQPRHPQAIPLDEQRQRFELELIKEVERRRMPTLGICLGSQMINVHRGGSLHQFLPDVPRENALEHRKTGQEPTRHTVSIDPRSLLHQTVGKSEILANSYHKQGIAKLGQGLVASAKAPDGVVEAVEDPSFPLYLAVQWHPERLTDEAEHLALFELLVRKSRR